MAGKPPLHQHPLAWCDLQIPNVGISVPGSRISRESRLGGSRKQGKNYACNIWDALYCRTVWKQTWAGDPLWKFPSGGGEFQLHVITLNIWPCSLLHQDWCPAAFCPFPLHNEPQLFVSPNLSLRPTFSHWLWIINLFHENVGFRNLLLQCWKGCHHFREKSIKWKASHFTWD